METWNDSRPGSCNISTVVESEGLFRSCSVDPCSEKHLSQQHLSLYGTTYQQKTASVSRT